VSGRTAHVKLDWSPGTRGNNQDLRLGRQLRRPRLQLGPTVVVTENWMLDLYAAVPLGLSRTFIRAPARRAFQERVEGGMGWYAGGALGMVWRLRPFNFIGELGYWATSLRPAPPSP
jgi:hypothetical protein